MRRKNLTIVLTIAIAACLGWRATAFCQSDSALLQRQLESQAVEEFLKSLQLDDLIVEHLELETSREIDQETRRATASRLINEYAKQMISGRELAGSDWQSKAELMLQTYPELSTPSIRIAILQSQYASAEKAFREWWNSGRDENLRSKVVDRWQKLKNELETLNRRLNLDYEDQVAVLQTAMENNEAQSRQLARLDALLLHTDYLIGWSSYFLGVSASESRRQLMLNADSHFRTFLQIEPKKTLTEVAPEWLDFSSEWNTRALVGLAMAQRALDHPLQSEYCFELIENHATSQQTRDLRFVWDLNSRVYVDEVSAAQEFVDSLGEAGIISASGRTGYWMAVLNASNAMKNRVPAISKRLLDSGLKGLARQFDSVRLRRFIDENQLDLNDEEFLSLWIGGLLDYHDAEGSLAADKYSLTKLKLRSAIAMADSTTNRLDVARCQFLLAKIQLHERDYESAWHAFLECSRSFDTIAPELSAESQWLAVRALSEHSRTHSRSVIQANRAIDQLLHRFPGSSFAKRAEFEKLRLNVADLSAEKAVDRLRSIPPGDSNYPLAANEIVKIRYQSWLDAHETNSDSERQSFQDLLVAATDYQRLAAASDESKLKSQLLVVDAMLRTDSIDLAAVRHRMDLMTKSAEATEKTNPGYLEYRYYRFLLAHRAEDQPQALAESNWLTNNAPDTPIEKSALIKLAQLSNERLKQKTNPTKADLAELTSIFSRLVVLLGSSNAELNSSANARVAFARLAELKLESGSPDEAIEMLVTLNQLFPNHKSYLRQLGSTYMRSKKYSESISIWQKLIRGVDPGSELWIESKYNLANCLYHVGKQQESRQLHEQTRRLIPELPESWVERFDELSALLETNE